MNKENNKLVKSVKLNKSIEKPISWGKDRLNPNLEILLGINLNRLIQKYEKLRAKFFRKAQIATREKDIDAQLIYATYQTAYTEIQVDLESLLKSINKNS